MIILPLAHCLNSQARGLPSQIKLHHDKISRVGKITKSPKYLGERKEQNFDIMKEAGGKYYTAIMKNYTVPVTRNFIEIHLFWAGKGTCCIPREGYYGPSISALSVTPNFNPRVDNAAENKSSSKTGVLVGVVVGATLIGLAALAAVFVWSQKRRKLSREQQELYSIVGRPNVFSYGELRSATENFSSSNLLGEGGYGSVYKGKLTDGRVIAVKQLSQTSHQGKRQFATEIETISRVQHRNLVKLYGCCLEGNHPLLVYEYLENGSLDKALFVSRSLNLDWATRFEIILGVAKGLAYLHEESRIRVVHRDIKASNVLLDTNLNPKISDFGLAKLYDDKKTHVSTKVAGTFGYLAPEYAMRGHMTEKVDVFAFGVVLLETLAGRPNYDNTLEEDKIYIFEWVWGLYESNQPLDIVDPSLTEFNGEEVLRAIHVALLCTQGSPHRRPSMSRVVAMLTGDAEVAEVAAKPSYITEWQIKGGSTTGFTSGDASGDGQPSPPPRPTSTKASPPILSSVVQEGRKHHKLSGPFQDSTNPARGRALHPGQAVLLDDSREESPFADSVELALVSRQHISRSWEEETRKRREMRFRLRLRVSQLQLHGSLLLLLLLRLLLLAAVAQGQQAPRTTTDPTEAAALNAVFAKLGQTAHSSWNISGDPCTGSATDATDIDSNNNVNPGIKCDCSARNNTLCHITKLKIYAMSAAGQIPQELRNLTRLTNLFLGNNSLSGSLPSSKGSSLRNLDFSYNLLSGNFPSWASEKNLQLNLVANNFVIDKSNNRNPSSLREFVPRSSLVPPEVHDSGLAWELYENHRPLDIVDPELTEFNEDEVLRAIHVALLCTQGSPHQRPSMSRVVAMLTGDVEVAKVVTKPSYISEWQIKGGNTSFMDSNVSGESSSLVAKPTSQQNSSTFLSSVIQEGR
ncbi:hypothetical protein GUJ93_ZPchr0004g38173 [Zizania palustris]|uniref:non-specific serine/threonine protein kinase n=1 Tax=Zizania palustris TaxID=103762 RepID=A0A8J5SDQ7_ZIZPA|nr:hypothetical protein GUJ93_ZPchr0004g38173 [Zizania palustris]